MSDNNPPKPDQEITSNALFGATPPTDDTVSSPPPPRPLESSQPPPSSQPAQTLELSEHPRSRSHHPSAQTPPPLPVLPVPLPHTTARPQPHTSLYTYIRRTTYLFSLVLGVSATVALFWSAFLLPLLHSSFSARRVIVEQQLERIKSLVSGLKDVRGRSLYAPAIEIEDGGTGDQVSGTPSEHDSTNQDTDDPSTSTSTAPVPSTLPTSGLVPEISTLSIPLKSLSSALEATSTTRTSVLASLESYTSQLHREIYLRNPSTASRMPVGLGTLSSNLSKESGGSGLSEIVGNARADEWDAVRKDIRAIKGLLLGRRSFTPT